MIVLNLEPPANPFVSLAEAKARLRVDGGEDDAQITALLMAAQAHLEGPQGWLGRTIARQQLEARIACAPHNVSLPYPPFHQLVSVAAVALDGTPTEIDLADVRIEPGRFGSAVISPKAGRWGSERLRVRYTAGYEVGDPRAAPIHAAILLMVGHLYDNREAVTDRPMTELPMGVESLLAPLQVW